MKNKIVSLNVMDLEEGMLLAEDMIDQNGRLLFSKNLLLTKSILEKIKILFKEKTIAIKLPRGFIELKPIQNETPLCTENSSSEAIKNTIMELNRDLKDLFLKVEKNEIIGSKSQFSLIVNRIKKEFSISIELLNQIMYMEKSQSDLYSHSINVAVISSIFGVWVGLNNDSMEKLILSALLHDIGKIKIDESILNKPSKLNEIEYNEIKKHPFFSHQVLKELGIDDEKVIKAVTLHHEKEDGKGYPLGLTGHRIPLFAKIIAIADIFDAMTSNRVYKSRVNPFKVLEMLKEQAFGQLDYGLTMLFIMKFSQFYIGTKVVLNNKEQAKILSLNNYEITKPLLMTDSGKVIDMSSERKLYIKRFPEILNLNFVG